jgi:hypothetical protein
MRPSWFRQNARMRDERGQATTEFALIFIPLIMVVAGIIYFGIGLNYWLDMNRAANQGARWAAVDNWAPYCLRSDMPANGGSGCNAPNPSASCSAVLNPGSPHTQAALQDVVRCSPRNNPLVTLCYPGKTAATATIGDPVQVKATAPYKFFFFNSFRVTLTARATMRLEQKPVLQSTTGQVPAGSGGPTCT